MAGLAGQRSEKREGEKGGRGRRYRSCAMPVVGHFCRVITLVAVAAVLGVWRVPCGRGSNPPGRTPPPPVGEGGGARAVGNGAKC